MAIMEHGEYDPGDSPEKTGLSLKTKLTLGAMASAAVFDTLAWQTSNSKLELLGGVSSLGFALMVATAIMGAAGEARRDMDNKDK